MARTGSGAGLALPSRHGGRHRPRRLFREFRGHDVYTSSVNDVLACPGVSEMTLISTVSHHDATLTGGNIEHHSSGRNPDRRSSRSEAWMAASADSL